MVGAPFLNCDECRGTSGAAGCPTHSGGAWARYDFLRGNPWSLSLSVQPAPVELSYGDGVADERKRIRKAVDKLPVWDKRSVPGGFHIKRADVYDILDEARADDGTS